MELTKREVSQRVLLDNIIAKIKDDLYLGDESFLASIINGDGFKQINNLTDEELNTEVDELMAEQKDNRFIEYSSDKTLHGLENGMAYYNYQGNHFRVFASFEDGCKFCESSKSLDELVIADFESEEDMDKYLEKII